MYRIVSHRIVSYCIISYRIVLYCITSYRIVSYSYRIVSYHIVSYCIILYRIVLYHIISYRIVSYDIVSYCIISYRIVLYHIISYRIVSYHIVSYCIILYRIVVYHIVSHHIVSYSYSIVLYCLLLFVRNINNSNISGISRQNKLCWIKIRSICIYSTLDLYLGVKSKLISKTVPLLLFYVCRNCTLDKINWIGWLHIIVKLSNVFQIIMKSSDFNRSRIVLYFFL